MVMVLRGEGRIDAYDKTNVVFEVYNTLYGVPCETCHAPVDFYCKFDRKKQLCRFRHQRLNSKDQGAYATSED